MSSRPYRGSTGGRETGRGERGPAVVDRRGKTGCLPDPAKVAQPARDGAATAAVNTGSEKPGAGDNGEDTQLHAVSLRVRPGPGLATDTRPRDSCFEPRRDGGLVRCDRTASRADPRKRQAAADPKED